MRSISLLFASILLLTSLALSQANPHSVPDVDAGLGPCTSDFIITDADNKPVYNAKINVRVQYGVFHRLDLEVATNIDGKARFTGLPTNPRRGLFYQASEGDRTGNAFQDPSTKCNANFTVVLRKSTQPQDQQQDQ